MSDSSIRALVSQRTAQAAQTAAELCGDDVVAELAAAGEALVAGYRAGGKMIICGNGGSAAQASHIAAELVGRFLSDRPPLAAVALGDNHAALTALSNDYGYERSFARQVEAHLRPEDVVVGLSTSGTSPNVVEALRLARDRGATTVGLCGRHGEGLEAVCDHLLAVPCDDTPRIQEAHLVMGHILCEIVEAELFGP